MTHDGVDSQRCPGRSRGITLAVMTGSLEPRPAGAITTVSPTAALEGLKSFEDMALDRDPVAPSELRDALGRNSSQRTTAAAIRRAISRHPSFRRSTGERYSIGTPATG